MLRRMKPWSVRLLVPDRLDPDAHRPGSGFSVLGNELNDLDGYGDRHLPNGAAAAAIDIRIVLGPERDVGLVDLDDVGEHLAVRVHHRSPKLVQHQPGRLVEPQLQLLVELESGDPVGVAGDQVGAPEPVSQWQLGSVHDCARGQRGLPPTASAAPEEWPIRLFPGAVAAAMRTDEPVRPADVPEITSAGLLVGETSAGTSEALGQLLQHPAIVVRRSKKI